MKIPNEISELLYLWKKVTTEKVYNEKQLKFRLWIVTLQYILIRPFL